MLESRAWLSPLPPSHPLHTQVFCGWLAPFVANGQVWGPRTMAVASSSMQRKDALKRASKKVSGEKGGWAARKGRREAGIVERLPGT